MARHYALNELNEHNPERYNYIQKKSQMVCDIVIYFGFDFYITGLDSLIGEMFHVPEKYTVLLVVEKSRISKVQEILSEKMSKLE